MSAPFDIQKTPLMPGATLIEASAGTGKTYTIAGIFVRLLLEHGLEAREILVTTYTQAATAELRGRIRVLLGECLAAARGLPAKDLAKQLITPGKAVEKKLEQALRSFDETAIHTIHGFCQRTLQDRTFESGLAFDSEFITDQNALAQEIADDFWRREFYTDASCCAALAAEAGLTPTSLVSLLRETLNRPDLVILPPTTREDLEKLKLEIGERFEEVRECWRAEEDEIRRRLHDGKWFHATKFKAVAKALDEAASCMEMSAGRSFGCFSKLATSALEAAKVKNATAPKHPFFDLCENLGPLVNAYGASLRSSFAAWSRGELARRKQQRNVLSFDDLLTRLHGALTGEGGDALAAAVRSRFRAALIDEFQDADTIQDAIFQRLFATDDRFLFLIGDPKQAIYGFRGADVFSYLRASAHIAPARHHTLPTNWRSERALVGAVNHLFSRAPAPFLLPGIEFTPVAASGNRDAEPLLIDGNRPPPLTIRHWDTPEPISATEAKRVLPKMCAAEIARLLASDARIGGDPLGPRDIAVLVATHEQAAQVQGALAALRIPSVLLGKESVFKSREARELRTILAAIAEPAREGFVRAALATDVLGVPAAELDARWEAGLERFQERHERWLRQGFIQMFRLFLRQENVRERLLAWPNGERRLTNFLHLGELLHRGALARRLTPLALLKWLGAQIADPAKDGAELRLDRDDDAVSVVTMHSSKGLEYNVVFCPFIYRGAQPRPGSQTIYHDPAEDDRLTLDLIGDDDADARMRHELLAEQLRILYVALTRARHACHIVWGRFNKHEVSAGAWLLHRPPGAPESPVDALKAHMKNLTAETLASDLAALAAGAPESIRVLPMPALDAPIYRPIGESNEPLAAREFRGHIANDWRISSFTSLTHSRDEDVPDLDRADDDAAAVEEVVVEMEPPSGIHALPAGAKTGACLHEIFEHLDFTNLDHLDQQVARRLAAHSFDSARWREVVTDAIRATLTAELLPGLRLDSIKNDARLIELEFTFPCGLLDPATLQKLVRAEVAGRFSFEPVRGMIKGFIDLVFRHDGRFYIVDWKSNRLGTNTAAYASAELTTAMSRDRYGLQYHLYTVALHRYLARRIPGYDYDKHFGGVFYLFLRGIGKNAHGIFHDKPTRTVIEQLDAHFSTHKTG